MTEVHYNLLLLQFEIAIVNKDGVIIDSGLSAETNWDIAYMIQYVLFTVVLHYGMFTNGLHAHLLIFSPLCSPPMMKSVHFHLNEPSMFSGILPQWSRHHFVEVFLCTFRNT